MDKNKLVKPSIPSRTAKDQTILKSTDSVGPKQNPNKVKFTKGREH